MQRSANRRLALLAGVVAVAVSATPAWSACCYFSAKNADILQPAQKVFITWDPAAKMETFTVQPKFEGNALDFGMVIPTPSQPKLHEMPRDFFKHLAVYSLLKRREFPRSKLLPVKLKAGITSQTAFGNKLLAADDRFGPPEKKPTVVVLEAGVVGSLDYKVISAERADDLYQWLKDQKYSYS